MQYREKHKIVSELFSRPILVSIVDDDESVRDALMGLIRSFGYRTESFASAEDFLGANILHKTSCLIVDLHMPVMTGLELQCRLRSHGRRIPMIFITAHDDPAARTRALTSGAIDFLIKPFAGDVLLHAIRLAINGPGDA
jgi:FixJ family two-component response regulator